jgi:hypothetical protein
MGFDKTNISGDSVSGFEQTTSPGTSSSVAMAIVFPARTLFRQELHL